MEFGALSFLRDEMLDWMAGEVSSANHCNTHGIVVRERARLFHLWLVGANKPPGSRALYIVLFHPQ